MFTSVVHVDVCVHLCMHLCIHSQVYDHVPVRVYMQTHMYTYTHTCTHPHTHMHTIHACRREAVVHQQLDTFASCYHDAPLPHDLLLPLLLDDVGPGPATVARTLHGNCLAASHAPGGVVLLLSASGAIGGFHGNAAPACNGECTGLARARGRCVRVLKGVLCGRAAGWGRACSQAKQWAGGGRGGLLVCSQSIWQGLQGFDRVVSMGRLRSSHGHTHTKSGRQRGRSSCQSVD